MTAIPRYRPHLGPVLFSAGFRPFFLLAALWAALAVPLWIFVYAGEIELPTALSPLIWHVHEMVFGFGSATVAGFLLTSVPNWTGRMPLQGWPLASLVLLWLAGRIAVLCAAIIGVRWTAAIDLSFPFAFLWMIAREIIAGRNWRNLPVLVALATLLSANLLIHLQNLGLASSAELGGRLGVATLLMLIAFVGGRIIPSFTRNWLAKQRPEVPLPIAFSRFDIVALAFTAGGLLAWVAAPGGYPTPWIEAAAGCALGLRLARWRGQAVLGEPLLWVLHLGYGWLVVGLLLLATDQLIPVLPQTTALHALTSGAIGTMTLAVMTRASLGHTGRPLVAGRGTILIYGLVTLAAVLRLLAPVIPEQYLLVLSLAAIAWCSAFGLFVLLYGGPLSSPRVKGEAARPI